MKVIHIIPSLNKGGAERLCLDICNHLNKHEGIDVLLILFRNHNQYSFLTQSLNIKVVNVFAQLSILKTNLIDVSELQSEIDNFKPDIIHTHLFEAEVLSRFCYYPNAKWFSHGHDNMVQFENFKFKTLFSKKMLTNFFEKSLLLKHYRKNGGTNFIAISNHTYQYFSCRIKNNKLNILRNAIDIKRFENNRTKTSSNIFHLVNIGSFVKKKNQTFLLDVLKKLNKSTHHFHLHLIGDGSEKENVIKKAQLLNLENQITFYGSIDNVEEILWKSDLYIHSATYEPLGLVLLEAMAAKLPIVTLDGFGNRDLIQQGKNGYIISDENIELFCHKIVELKEDKTKYDIIASYAKEFSKGFDIKGYIKQLLNLYN